MLLYKIDYCTNNNKNDDKNDDKNNPKNNPIYGKIPLNKIPNAESLQDTYNRVIHYFNKKIKQNLQEEKNIIISAHGNSLRALCKKIFKISNQKIAKLEIPTGNPLVINLSQNLKILDCKYLDEGREKEIGLPAAGECKRQRI